MFSAMMQMISGEIVPGALMMCFMALFAASYFLLTRGGSGYPTNMCVVGCILCAIASDVIWGLFIFGSTPFFATSASGGTVEKLFFEFMASGVIFFCGLSVTNIVRVPKFRKTKIALFAVFIAVTAVLALNTMTVRPFKLRLVIPPLSLAATNVILVVIECAIIISLGATAIFGRKTKSKINAVTAAILAALTVAAGAIGISHIV